MHQWQWKIVALKHSIVPDFAHSPGSMFHSWFAAEKVGCSEQHTHELGEGLSYFGEYPGSTFDYSATHLTKGYEFSLKKQTGKVVTAFSR